MPARGLTKDRAVCRKAAILFAVVFARRTIRARDEIRSLTRCRPRH